MKKLHSSIIIKITFTNEKINKGNAIKKKVFLDNCLNKFLFKTGLLCLYVISIIKHPNKYIKSEQNKDKIIVKPANSM